MTAKEKANLLDSTIKQLYVDECRSISYIHRLLKIDRNTLSRHIKAKGYVQLNMDKKKIARFLKSYRERLISCIKNGYTKREICTIFKVGMIFLNKVIEYDEEIMNTKKNSRVNEPYVEIEGEIWKTVDGYPYYEASNLGRVRSINGIKKPSLNKLHNRYYISLVDGEGKTHNLILARVIAGLFCERPDEKCNTVNHKDGDTLNNKAENLEWVTQSDNNLHSYRVLNRKKSIGRKLPFVILYKDKYEFKTITAFSRFLMLSETQTRRWVFESPEKHDIKHIVTTIPKGSRAESPKHTDSRNEEGNKK